jgi:hypothetical protein
METNVAVSKRYHAEVSERIRAAVCSTWPIERRESVLSEGSGRATESSVGPVILYLISRGQAAKPPRTSHATGPVGLRVATCRGNGPKG